MAHMYPIIVWPDLISPKCGGLSVERAKRAVANLDEDSVTMERRSRDGLSS